MSATGSTSPLGVICGAGEFPLAVARAARSAGRDVFLLGIEGFVDGELAGWPHARVRLGRIGALLAALRGANVRDLVIVGGLTRPAFRDLRLDFGALRLVPAFLDALRGGDDRLLSRVARFFEREGFRVLGAHEAAPGLLAPAGAIARRAPVAATLRDAEFAARLVAATGPFDAGQAAVVCDGHVWAIEAAEGTDAMLARVAELRASGRIRRRPPSGLLYKAPKPGQDRRVDLPALGPRTVEAARRAGLAAIAWEAGGALVLDREAMARAADAAGISLFGRAA
ncbi:MAG: UDP-2,3-diacylglucosamine diphosphatase LpxI [Hyphomicrobiales bacterium]|nr:UDP-2,3-diacylglucosamine diphosphatase LpxI [Hyphomicrobiales bacterium]